MKFMLTFSRQSAVIRGAALRGLEYIAPRSRQSRRHYGFSCGDVFREGIDDEDDSYPCAITGEKYCSGRMLWTIEKVFYSKSSCSVYPQILKLFS